MEIAEIAETIVGDQGADPIEPLAVDTPTAARLLGVSESALNKARIYAPERSPPFRKIGRRVVYPLEGLRAFLAQR